MVIESNDTDMAHLAGYNSTRFFAKGQFVGYFNDALQRKTGTITQLLPNRKYVIDGQVITEGRIAPSVTPADERDNIFAVPDVNVTRLFERLNELDGKARQLGNGHVNYGVVGTREIELTDYNGDRTGHFTYLHYVMVEGTSPKLNGWKLIGVIDHVTTMHTLVRDVPGQRVPKEYRKRGAVCDHCDTLRKRNETFIIRHDDGTIKQVGRNCLADFLGHKDPAAVAFMAQFYTSITTILDEEEQMPSDMTGASHIDLHRFLTYVVASIRTHGWRSKGEAYEMGMPSTVDNVYFALSPQGRDEVELTDADRTEAEQVITWAKTLPEDVDKNFLYNLRVIADDGRVFWKTAGYAAAMVPSFRRAQEQPKRTAMSKHVGQIKERTVFTLTVDSVRTFSTGFGVQSLFKMLDKQGNVFVWFTSAEDLEQGKTYEIKGTIKAHDSYNNVKQTVLTRCKVQQEITP